MKPATLEEYLHTHIPLTQSMGIKVAAVEPNSVAPNSVTLCAPLTPNINHQQTAFGGSLASLATLSAWCTILVALKSRGLTADIVVRKSQVDYLEAVREDFCACAVAPPNAWQSMGKTLAERGKARITLQSEILEAGRSALRFTGEFVVLLRNHPATN